MLSELEEQSEDGEVNTGHDVCHGPNTERHVSESRAGQQRHKQLRGQLDSSVQYNLRGSVQSVLNG